MKFVDFSPRSAPTRDEQEQALQKGLGRTAQWAAKDRLDHELLLRACLQDRRFDAMFEKPRGDWLWQLVAGVGVTDKFRVPILHALNEFSDESSASQLCQLARCYAERGDHNFRDRLYEIVDQKPFPDSPWLGEVEIVQLDGKSAFLHAVQVRGERLKNIDWDWHDSALVDFAVESFGEEQVNGLLEASADDRIVRFQKLRLQDMRTTVNRSGRREHEEKMKAIPAREIIEAANSNQQCSWFRSWGRHADDGGLKAVLEHLCQVQESGEIARLLRVFSARALPEFDDRLIELCRREEDDIRRWALSALEHYAHSRVREFALSELANGLRDGVAALFINNYHNGDEQRILDALELPDEAEEVHSLMMDVMKVLEHNSQADCSKLGIVCYAMTPCEMCRFHAARMLVNQEVAPKWLKEECRTDSGEDCRKLVG